MICNSIGFFGYLPNLVTKMTTFIVFSVLENIGLPVFWDKFRQKIFSLFSGRWSRLAKLCSVKQLTCAVPSWLGTRYTHTHTHTPTGSGAHEVWCMLSLRWRHGISGGWSDGIRHATNRITWPGSYESWERCHVTSNIPIKTQSRYRNPRDPIANHLCAAYTWVKLPDSCVDQHIDIEHSDTANWSYNQNIL